MFVQHVHLLHTERDMGFLAEYQNLQQSASFTGINGPTTNVPNVGVDKRRSGYLT